MSGTRIHRLLRLIMAIESGQARTAEDLQAILQVSRRTLFRDLEVLREAGIPYYAKRGHGYRMGRSFYLPPISLSAAETIGLMLLGEYARGTRDQPMMRTAFIAVTKLANALDKRLREACADLIDCVSVSPPPTVTPTETDSSHFMTLQQAVDESRPCVVEYRSPTEPEPQRLTLEPLALHFCDRAWYVFARSQEHDEIRMFKLVRFKAVQATDERFSRPSFEPSDKIGLAWRMIPEGEVSSIKLRFSPKVSANVAEVRWHDTQEQRFLDDGSCEMTFRVDGLNEISWWLCGYAGEVTILEPASLRQKVRQMHRRAAQLQDA